jgi:cbb3-type cytochrome oxidase subunit 3
MSAYAGERVYESAFNVMLDVDSTILPLLEMMATREGGSRIAYADCPEYEMLHTLVDGGVPRMLTMFDECCEYEVMRDFAPFTGAVAMTQALAALGVRFHVKTERSARFAEGTRRYLDEYAIPYVSFRCQRPLDKVGECAAEAIAIAIDDHTQFIAAASAAGLTVMTLGYPYNAAICRQTGAKHARDWLDLAQHVIVAVEEKIVAAIELGPPRT